MKAKVSVEVAEENEELDNGLEESEHGRVSPDSTTNMATIPGLRKPDCNSFNTQFWQDRKGKNPDCNSFIT